MLVSEDEGATKVFLYSRIKVMRKRPEKGWDRQECECEILGFSNAEVACQHCGTILEVNRGIRREKRSLLDHLF